eukprot:357798-Chlamydomonas_euryale.AAC.7
MSCSALQCAAQPKLVWDAVVRFVCALRGLPGRWEGRLSGRWEGYLGNKRVAWAIRGLPG